MRINKKNNKSVIQTLEISMVPIAMMWSGRNTVTQKIKNLPQSTALPLIYPGHVLRECILLHPAPNIPLSRCQRAITAQLII